MSGQQSSEDVLVRSAPQRTTSKYVSDAFSFLNMPEYQDVHGGRTPFDFKYSDELKYSEKLKYNDQLKYSEQPNYSEQLNYSDQLKYIDKPKFTDQLKNSDQLKHNEPPDSNVKGMGKTDSGYIIVTSLATDTSQISLYNENICIDANQNGDMKNACSGEFTIATNIDQNIVTINENNQQTPVLEVFNMGQELTKKSSEYCALTCNDSNGHISSMSDGVQTQELVFQNTDAEHWVTNNIIGNFELRQGDSDNVNLRLTRDSALSNQRMISEVFQFLKEMPDVGDDTDVCNEVSLQQSNIDNAVTSEHLPDMIQVTKEEDSQSNSDVLKDDMNDNLEDVVGELRRVKNRSNRKGTFHETCDDDGGSSDDDTGVYHESFRKSTWLYVGDNVDISKGQNTTFVPMGEQGVDVPESPLHNTSVPQKCHQRNDSTSTTLSENEFKNHYNSVSKRCVKRADSQQQYKRFTIASYDCVKVITVERDSSSEFGIHILESRPAIISGVDKGSAAERAGVKEGQIVISVNGVNVLEADHDEIIHLVHRDVRRLVLELGSGNMSPMVDLQVPVRTGFLQKQTTSTIFRSWKRRFFILRRDDCLYYYKNEQESDPLGAIPLSGYTVSRHGDAHKFGFKAEKYNNRTYHFMAESREDMTNWVGAMNDAAKSATNMDSWLDVTANNVDLPALSIRNPDCSGYLQKMGRATIRWRKHYCVLKDACIYYYKSSSSKEAEGVAHLHGYMVKPEGVSGKKNSFTLHPPEPQMRVFSFYADNNTDKFRWICALNSSIKKWVRVD